MIRRSTWIVLVVFAVLVVTAVLWQRYIKDEESVEATPTLAAIQQSVFDLGSKAILWMRFSDTEGSQVEIEREDASSAWILAGESEETTDTFRIGTITGQLLGLKATTSLGKELGIEVVGLDHPSYTIAMRTSAGEEMVVKVGNLTAIGNGYYIQVDDNDVMVVDKLILDEVLGIITEPPLAATPTPEVTETALPEIETTPTP